MQHHYRLLNEENQETNSVVFPVPLFSNWWKSNKTFRNDLEDREEIDFKLAACFGARGVHVARFTTFLKDLRQYNDIPFVLGTRATAIVLLLCFLFGIGFVTLILWSDSFDSTLGIILEIILQSQFGTLPFVALGFTLYHRGRAFEDIKALCEAEWACVWEKHGYHLEVLVDNGWVFQELWIRLTQITPFDVDVAESFTRTQDDSQHVSSPESFRGNDNNCKEEPFAYLSPTVVEGDLSRTVTSEEVVQEGDLRPTFTVEDKVQGDLPRISYALYVPIHAAWRPRPLGFGRTLSRFKESITFPMAVPTLPWQLHLRVISALITGKDSNTSSSESPPAPNTPAAIAQSSLRKQTPRKFMVFSIGLIITVMTFAIFFSFFFQDCSPWFRVAVTTPFWMMAFTALLPCLWNNRGKVEVARALLEQETAGAWTATFHRCSPNSNDRVDGIKSRLDGLVSLFWMRTEYVTISRVDDVDPSARAVV